MWLTLVGPELEAETKLAIWDGLLGSDSLTSWIIPRDRALACRKADL